MIGFISTGSYLLSGTKQKCIRQKIPCIVCASEDKKSSALYKRPSIAIEKGGGFYIPGLEGPKLRLSVSLIALGLLAVNHPLVSSNISRVPQSALNQQVSELVSLVAAVSLGTAAVFQILAEKATQETIGRLQDSQYSESIDSEDSSGSESESFVSIDASLSEENIEDLTRSKSGADQGFLKDVSWLGESIVELTPSTLCVILQNEKIVKVSGNASSLKSTSKTESMGAVIERVVEEQMALYIEDVKTLPKNINIPFLVDDHWTAFVVPRIDANCVVVCAGKRDLQKNVETTEPLFSLQDRRWIENACKVLKPVEI
eukprot:CAMPEP_0182445978 /NCGR_PEP_ID=MMETSP1172-20130603/3908_1 /TAXON_ID=708627 /ORGANISM="Timspurckia oligopyrenoides, Strain CCMP3278" /LENGTH=315 /DNA_ID=CAMNT_0024641831 /DNA_START=50 /DNA_END=997 /DNA_ORIENTATION=-